jgi:hypothetical protein
MTEAILGDNQSGPDVFIEGITTSKVLHIVHHKIEEDCEERKKDCLFA